jgi:hypothetical protein
VTPSNCASEIVMKTPITPDGYTGRTALTVDGDDLGVVEDVITEAVAEPHLVIRLTGAVDAVGSERVYVPSCAIAGATDRDVVIGATSFWLAPNGWTEPPVTG